MEIETRIKNSSKDHLLRVLFPAKIKSKTFFSEGHFDLIERKSQTKESKVKEYPFEAPPFTFPQQNFVVLKGKDRTFTLINQGLPEGEVRENGEIYL